MKLSRRANISIFIITVASFWFSLVEGYAQSDITSWKKASINGGLNATGTYYEQWGGTNRRDPYFWMLQANLSITLGPLSLPFSASISTQQRDFRYPKPFNHFGISPSYKAVTVHAGYRSMQFSEFTMAGVEFLGGGVEVKPENSGFSFGAMYGRLQKAGTDRSFTGIPQYERWGGGFVFGYTYDKGNYKFSAFKAQDRIGTLDDSTAAANEVSPGENLVMGITAEQSISQKLSVNLDYAFSAFSTDIRMPEIVFQEYTYINNFGNLFTPRASSITAGAFSGGLDWNEDSYGFNVKYRRISPDYASMGVPFLTNDFEDVTAGVNIRLLQGKVNLAANGGMQRNNLEGDRTSEMRRWIGSVVVNWTAMERLQFNANYANFNVSTQMSTFVQSSDGLVPDTVLMLQINKNASLGVNYSFGGTNTQSVVVLGMWQEASNNQGTGNTFYNLNASYQWSSPMGWNANVGVNANNNVMVGAENQSIGPSFTLAKSFKQIKLRNTINVSNQQTFTDKVKSANTVAVRLSSSYPVAKKQNLSYTASFTNRKAFGENFKDVSELRMTLNYNYRF